MEQLEIIDNISYFQEIVDYIKTTDLSKQQVMITTRTPDADIYTDGIGGIDDYPEGTREPDWKYLNNVYKGTIIETFYNDINTIFPLGRLRIMNLQPKTCYGYHYDWKSMYPGASRNRLHLPILGDEDAFFVIEDEIFKMKYDGSLYNFNTCDVKHTFVNASRDKVRTHLVGVML